MSLSIKYNELKSLGNKSNKLSFEAQVTVIHDRTNNRYDLLTFIGAFLEDAPINQLIPVDRTSLSAGRTAILFRLNLDFLNLDSFISNISPTTMTIPFAAPGNGILHHALNLNDLRPISYSTSDDRPNGAVSFLPPAESGVTFLELVDISKPILKSLSQNDIEKVQKILHKYSDFSLLVHDSKIGNAFITGAFDPIDISFRGDSSGQGLLVKLTPKLPGISLTNYALTVTTERHEEFLGSSYIYPVHKSIKVPMLDQSGKIDLRLWNISDGRLCGHNTGYMIGGGRKGGGFHTRSYSSFSRNAILRDSAGKTKAQETISVRGEPHGGSYKNPENWSSLTSKQLLNAQKKDLIEQKKLIHLANKDHFSALLEIVSALNRNQDVDLVKVWDPYVGPYFLDFLTFLKFQCEIRIVSELGGYLGPAPKSTSFQRAWYAIENVFTNMSDTPAVVNKYLQSSRQKRNQDRIRQLKENTKGYLDELKGMNLNIKLRYVGNGKGQSFHDRFIFAGNKCWSLGSSLNSIGSSHSLIYEVPYPELIENEFDKLWHELDGNEL